ncbi:UNVERIFIED_CONTAM: hypothetical protein Sangu_2084700 [Sesamum angustifolium]|uniref:Uncharacterized protein n=1 Tax=Sesamum angustifolium TaxID=2727405 RepID=A0AAW2LLN7_9LAMI
MAEPPPCSATISAADSSASSVSSCSSGFAHGSSTENPCENKCKKRARDSGNKHPVYRGVRMRSWGNGSPKSASRGRSRAFGSELTGQLKWRRGPRRCGFEHQG